MIILSQIEDVLREKLKSMRIGTAFMLSDHRFGCTINEFYEHSPFTQGESSVLIFRRKPIVDSQYEYWLYWRVRQRERERELEETD